MSYPTELSWPGPQGGQTVNDPTELSWPGPQGGQTVSDPTELSWLQARTRKRVREIKRCQGNLSVGIFAKLAYIDAPGKPNYQMESVSYTHTVDIYLLISVYRMDCVHGSNHNPDETAWIYRIIGKSHSSMFVMRTKATLSVMGLSSETCHCNYRGQSSDL